jgi:hypothetical protein
MNHLDYRLIRPHRFAETFCSQCGKSLGPGNSGLSHCKDHGAPARYPDADASHQFVAVGPKVIRDNQLIAGAVSSTFARRIANALNVYKPDRRGL